MSPVIQKLSKESVGLAVEFVVLFVAFPFFLFFMGSRLGIYVALWGAGLYAFLILRRSPDFSWDQLWNGNDWRSDHKRFAFFRFVGLAALLTLLTVILVPDRLMRFPLDRFPLWFAVMVLYPLLSVVPQELFFRSFYFARYGGLAARGPYASFINGSLFGLSHIILNNWVAPSCCALGGILLAYSYQQHRSLKWAVIEHSLYGCWIFTVGIGWYFFTGNWRH